MRSRYGAACVGVAALGLALAELPAAAQSLERVLNPYLRIHANLAADKLDGVEADAKTLAAEAEKLGDPGGALVSAARDLAKASDLKGARSAFGKLSEALLAYVSGTKQSLAPGLTVVYCPMVKQRWVQKGDQIANPYFGSQMLRCGEIQKR